MQVNLFGNFQIHTNTNAELELRPTAARLFAFLLLHRHTTLLREVVAEIFWQHSELDRARKSLNTALWQLRQALSQADNRQTMVIEATPEQIRINQGAKLWLDVASFEDKAKEGLAAAKESLSSAQLGALEAAVALYQGDLLNNFYDPWVLQERERLRLIYLRCLVRLMGHHHRQQNLVTSIDYGRRILSVEPWREDIHRHLMTLYAENGRRAEAIAQYQLCRQVLERELAVSPLAETEALYRQLLTNPAAAAFNRPAAGPTLPEATAQLQAAIQTMKEAQRSLDQAVALVERLSRSGPA
ncbi:MAG: hypothetical protein Kow0080_18830 [Candidatus Promineifilaceae bacterium]